MSAFSLRQLSSVYLPSSQCCVCITAVVSRAHQVSSEACYSTWRVRRIFFSNKPVLVLFLLFYCCWISRVDAQSRTVQRVVIAKQGPQFDRSCLFSSTSLSVDWEIQRERLGNMSKGTCYLVDKNWFFIRARLPVKYPYYIRGIQFGTKYLSLKTNLNDGNLTLLQHVAELEERIQERQER